MTLTFYLSITMWRVITKSRFTATMASLAMAVTTLLAASPSYGVVPPPDVHPRTTVSTAAASPAMSGPEVRTALTGFEPGWIIDDAVFFDKDIMDARQIQEFLDSKVRTCQSGYTCLKSYRGPTAYRAADAMCPRPYDGGGTESAAQIIAKVAQACGISPRVILVTLQKEQGLVTHTWPSDWRYTIAMGQGCPDTAACDERYYGFFNQVYGAAWQFKRYANPPGTSQYFTWYAPGKTWNIRYSPDASCGSSPVYVRTQATANLYYYTPYQPNAASLAAGLGTGDGCSTYGNRNFYNYFTDWFGTTRAGSITLARTAASEAVFLLDGSTKRQIPRYEDWVQLNTALGPTYTVSESFLAGYADAGTASAVLRNPDTGSMSLIQDGRRWGFTSCGQVADWGASCDNTVNISSTKYQAIPEAPLIGRFFPVNGTSRWAEFSSGKVQPYFDQRAAVAANGASVAASPRLPAWRWEQLAKLSLRLAPGQLVRTASNDAVYMTDGWDRLLWLASFDDAAEYGRSANSLAWVADGELAGYRWDGASRLNPFATCSGVEYFAGSGTLFAQASPGPSAMRTQLSDLTCAQMSRDTAKSARLFIAATGSSGVSLIDGTTARPVGSWSAAVAANGGASPRVVNVTPNTLAKFTRGIALFTEPSLIRSRDRVNVYLAMGDRKVGLPSFGLARDLGIGTEVSWHAQSEVDSLTTSPTELSSWITCEGGTFFAASGTLNRVSSSAATGFSPADLSATTCRALTRTDVEVSRVFVKGSADTVYLASGGVYRPIASWQALLRENGGAAPSILRVDDEVVRSWRLGPTIS